MNAVTPTPRRFTSAEFDRIARSGGFGRLRVELRRGWIVEMSPQYNPHLRLKMKLLFALQEAIEQAGLDLAAATEGSIAMGDTFEPMPDIVIFDPAVAPETLDGPLPAAAVKLVVEVGSSSLEDDLGDKRAEYAENGLSEYWVADVKARTLYRHAAPVGGAYSRIETTPLAEGFASLTLPVLRVAAGVVG